MRWIFAAAALAVASPSSSHQAPPQMDVKLDRSQADAALGIIDAANAGREPSAAELRTLFSSRPYIRLRERENAMKRPFTDEEFIAHLRSAEVRGSAPGLRSALGGWNEDVIAAAAGRAYAYLPAGAKLRATIFPMIKIKPNTFVFDLKNDPSIFYAIDPKEPQAKFANTLAHEMHHIGLGQNCGDDDLAGSERLKSLRGWVGAFGEGLAMVAAAGGHDIHPHAVSTAEERGAWDSEAAKFSTYLRQQDTFFRSVLAGTAGDKSAVDKAMFEYFGEQGPWYTVGWRMAVTIEQELGRPAVIGAFCRSHALLATYNRAAEAYRSRTGQRLATWTPSLANALAHGGQ